LLIRIVLQDNFKYLANNPVKTVEGIDIRFVVAAAIVAIKGMKRTLFALRDKMDERRVGHTTASILVNKPGGEESILYLARGTAFKRNIRLQGIGDEACRYSGRLVEINGEKRLRLLYDGKEPDGYPIVDNPPFCSCS